MTAEIWTAEYVLAGTARTGYGILVDGATVAELGPLDALRRRYPTLRIANKGRYLGPVLVNAHTHLDLGLLPTFKGSFTDFLGYVISHTQERGLKAARQALTAVAQRVVGSIAANDEILVDWLLSESELEGVVYWEVLGLLPPEKERELIENTRKLVKRWKKLERPGGMRLGLSPHATYSLSPGLMQAVVELAQAEGLLLQIHAAESHAEKLYFASRSGPIADFFKRRGLPNDMHPTGLSPIEYLGETGVLAARPTLVHGVQVSEDDVRLLAEFGTPVVSCPRSNDNLRVGLPPYQYYRNHGVLIALGTDSHASAESLDVRDEIKYLEDRGLPFPWLIQAATTGGYRALGYEESALIAGMPLEKVEFW
ncbi:amidohydrolase family protein [Oceanithermus sp.]